MFFVCLFQVKYKVTYVDWKEDGSRLVVKNDDAITKNDDAITKNDESVSKNDDSNLKGAMLIVNVRYYMWIL
jgi:hypothetical protein